jgi:alpha-amylase/alpha-mannosidase (GH57 family)
VTLRGIELEILRRVIPEYRDAAARGQIELSTSPFYHPILPLLCDTDIYKRTHPDSKMPRERFVRPEDAFEQLTRAADCHERLFGARPRGLWPSEGSVSEAMVPLVARAGFEWMATDEQVLALTLGTSFSRDGSGHSNQPRQLYTPWIVNTGGAKVACGFRDHALSDLIGFVYAGWAADAAADDFAARLSEAGRRHSAAGGGEATIFVILDGENAWEHFEGGGRPFLRALYRRLSGHDELRTVTMAEACRGGGPELNGIFPGSWIDANFYIWIGHDDDRRAWSQLGDARNALDSAGADAAMSPGALAQAREEVLIAEGSDWFWWYGDDHSSDHDLDFDELFRRHLRNAYRLLERPVPDELFVSNISGGGAAASYSEPTARIAPTIDGEETSYFEWLGAGQLEVREVAGAMHQAERQALLLARIQYGFDAAHLYLRVDGSRSMSDMLAAGCEVSLKFLQPEGVRLSIRRGADGTVGGALWDHHETPPRWRLRGPGRTRIAVGSVLEAAVPLSDLVSGTAVAFFVAVYNGQDQEVERHPSHRPIELTIPDARFDALNWTA